MADFHNPGVYRSGRAKVIAWDVFRRRSSRAGRSRRVAVILVAVLLCGLGPFKPLASNIRDIS